MPCLEIVKFLSEQHPDAIHTKAYHQEHLPLHVAVSQLACQKPTLSTIQFLLEQYPEAICEETASGNLPFHLAASKTCCGPSLQIHELLYELHPEAVHHANHNGDLPLHIVSRPHPPTSVFQFILQHSSPQAAAVKNKQGQLPLHTACSDSSRCISERVVRALLDVYPAGVFEKDCHGLYPMNSIAGSRYEPNPKIYSLLVDAALNAKATPTSVLPSFGLDVLFRNNKDSRFPDNANRMLPLHSIAKHGSDGDALLLQKMIKSYPKALTIRDDENKTALDYAALGWDTRYMHDSHYTQCRPALVRMLLEEEEGLEVLLFQDDKGLTVMDKFVQKQLHNPKNGRRGAEDSDDEGLDDEGNHQAQNKSTPQETLQYLVRQYGEAVAAALKRVGSPTRDGMVLRYACAHKSLLSSMAHLVPYYNKDLKIAHPESGTLPLHVAIQSGCNLDVLKLLVKEYPPALVARDFKGRSPLHVVCAGYNNSSRPDAVKLLVSQNPEAAKIADGDGHLPLHLYLAAVSVGGEELPIEDHVVQIILEGFPGATAVRNDAQQLPLDVCAGRQFKQTSVEVINMLLRSTPHVLGNI